MAAELATLAIETSRLYSDLVHRSEFDLLTDVHNRFSFESSLDTLIRNASQSGSFFGLIYIDLNEFKQVNDRYGHNAGDIYLQQVVGRMKAQIRPGDLLARLGGDEFAVLVPDVRGRGAVADVAQRLECCFDDPFDLPTGPIKGSASIGVALYPDDGTTRDSLLSAADAAMYATKRDHYKLMEIFAPRA
jgi:diguanylate cyclase (GGDEF)-like protein